MTKRITPNLDSTEEMLGVILLNIADVGERVAFIVPAGGARNVIARLRVMISRSRKSMYQRDKKPKRFTLRTTVHAETHGGTRYDCIVCWQERGDTHILAEELEDLLAK